MSQPKPALSEMVDSDHDPLVSFTDIFIAFTRSAMMSIGGGLTSWMMREFVDNRRWMTDTEFLTGLALAQAFPGVNVVNLSIWIGYRLRGGLGALVAALGMIVPPAIVAIVAVTVFDRLAQYHVVISIVAGIAAVAIGMSLSMGYKAVRATARHVAPVAVIVAMVVTLFFLQWPLLPVLAVLVPASIGLAFWQLRQQEKRP